MRLPDLVNLVQQGFGDLNIIDHIKPAKTHLFKALLFYLQFIDERGDPAHDLIIAIGQELNDGDIQGLLSDINRVNAMDDNELDVSFRRALLSSDPKDKELRGLLDLAICSKGELEPDTKDGSEFLGLKAVI